MTKKTLGPNTPSQQNPHKKSFDRFKQLALIWALSGITFGSPSCSNGVNWNTDPEKPKTEFVEKTNNSKEEAKFTWIDIREKAMDWEMEEKLEWKWIIICKNPDTKKVFLSDWTNKLTKEFDNIENVWVFDETMYFVWINNWKSSIINENWDTIISLDKTKSYTFHNWDYAVSWQKNWKTCLIYNGKIIDEGLEYNVTANWEYAENWIYAWATNYVDDYRITTFYINGKKVWPEFKHEYYEDSEYEWRAWVDDYGDTYTISWTSGNDTILIYNWKTIWKNLNDMWRVNNNSNFITYVKNWKECLLFTDWREFFIDKKPDYDSDNPVIYVNDWKKSYCISPDWELHECE